MYKSTEVRNAGKMKATAEVPLDLHRVWVRVCVCVCVRERERERERERGGGHEVFFIAMRRQIYRKYMFF